MKAHPTLDTDCTYTLTKGIVLALIDGLPRLKLQCNIPAIINVGNSGGPHGMMLEKL